MSTATATPAVSANAVAKLASATASPAPLPAGKGKGKGKINPVVEAYNTLRKLGLARPVNSDSLRATDYVAIAASARKNLGLKADDEFATGSSSGKALACIRIIERNANDCLPVSIGGPNPDHVRIGEVFASLLGFATDARKARNAQIAKYVGGLK